MKALPFLFVLLLVAGCVSSKPEDGYNFAGLHLRPSADWRIDVDRQAMAILEYNRGEKCKLAECPRLDLYTSNFSEWKTWFDGDAYVASGACNSGASGYALPERLLSGDIEVGGVKAEYFESASCVSGGGSRRTWLLRRQGEPSVIIQGIPAATFNSKNGDFPDDEVKRLLEAGTWK